jgi:hypothetical protein
MSCLEILFKVIAPSVHALFMAQYSLASPDEGAMIVVCFVSVFPMRIVIILNPLPR